MNHMYESIRIIEGTSNFSHLNGGYIDATHWESSSSADLPHVYFEF